jgi:hypothetical protein
MPVKNIRNAAEKEIYPTRARIWALNPWGIPSKIPMAKTTLRSF